MSWTLATSAAAIAKAGAAHNTIFDGAGGTTMLAKWSDQAEGRIVSQTRRDRVNSYSSLSTDIKNVLDDVASSIIAINIINYDMSAYFSLEQAQTMLDVNDNIVANGIITLSDFKSNTIREV